MSQLTWRGYSIAKSSISESEQDAIREELTVSPFVPKGYTYGTTPKYALYQESKNNLYVPKYYGIKKFGVPSIIKTSQGTEININFQGKLRDEQQKPVETMLNACHDPCQMGGILNVFCGGGKTTMALYIATKLKRKTLIIVHKDFLLEQWKERITLFLPDARIGLIKAKVIDVDDKDIVLCSLQSLSMKTYGAEVFSSFGTVIIDEIHHTSAEVFSKALAKVAFYYTLGLSATIKRKDGLSKVFIWYIGSVVFQSEKRSDKVNVHFLEYSDKDPKYSEEPLMVNGKLNMSKMINNICNHVPRDETIIQNICDILQKEPARKILILSDRRNHIVSLGQQLQSKGFDTGVYMGGMKSSILTDYNNKQIILATFAIASEGYDQPGLDTLVLASPKSDVIQAVGRILRDKESERKHIPLIVDVIDSHDIFVRQSQKREQYYIQCKWLKRSDPVQKSLFK